jgi:hypothetical protein
MIIIKYLKIPMSTLFLVRSDMRKVNLTSHGQTKKKDQKPIKYMNILSDMESKQMDNARSFMEEYQIMPIVSKQVYYSFVEWVKYCKSRNENPYCLEGQYSTTNLTAHIKKSEFVTLNYLHEYMGHGSFAEHSKTGKEFARYEQRLTLGENVREEYVKMFQSKYTLYEGFALWLEHKLALEIGLDNLVEKRHRLIHPALRDLRNTFDKFEQLYGTKYLIEEAMGR